MGVTSPALSVAQRRVVISERVGYTERKVVAYAPHPGGLLRVASAAYDLPQQQVLPVATTFPVAVAQDLWQCLRDIPLYKPVARVTYSYPLDMRRLKGTGPLPKGVQVQLHVRSNGWGDVSFTVTTASGTRKEEHPLGHQQVRTQLCEALGQEVALDLAVQEAARDDLYWVQRSLWQLQREHN